MKSRSKNGFQDAIHLGTNFSTILMDFGLQVGGPKTAQLGAQDGPRAAQEAPETAEEPPKSCPRNVQEPAKTRLGARGCPRAAQIPSRPRFSIILATILEHIW